MIAGFDRLIDAEARTLLQQHTHLAAVNLLVNGAQANSALRGQCAVLPAPTF